jgi:hypothetical protein
VVAHECGAVALVAVAWVVVSRNIEILSPDVQPQYLRFRISTFPLDRITETWRSVVSPLQDAHVPSVLDDDWYQALAGVLDLALVLGCAACILRTKAFERLWTVAVAALSAAILAGPALVVFNYVAQGIYVGVPPRYGLSLVPGLTAPLIVPLRSRPLFAVAAVLAVVIPLIALAKLAFV